MRAAIAATTTPGRRRATRAGPSTTCCPTSARRSTTSAAPMPSTAEAGGFIRSAPQEAIPDLQLHFVIGKLVDHGRRTVFGHGYSCHVCLLRPKSRGSLRLASADPLAAPRIDPNFLAE